MAEVLPAPEAARLWSEVKREDLFAVVCRSAAHGLKMRIGTEMAVASRPPLVIPAWRWLIYVERALNSRLGQLPNRGIFWNAAGQGSRSTKQMMCR
jgi:hypothetical protein